MPYQTTQLWSLGRHKVDGDAVNTMPLVRRHRVALPFEDMAQVATTGGARDLSPPAIRVGRTGDGPRQTLEEGRPSAARVEFGCGFVEWRCTASTVVHPFLVQLVVVACAPRLCALLAEDMKLVW